MQQELGLLDEAELNYISLIKHSKEIKYKINLYNLYITKGFYQNALEDNKLYSVKKFIINKSK